MNRRRFLERSGLFGAGLITMGALAPARASPPASERVIAAVMGLSRGKGHIAALKALPEAEIAYVCDADERRIAEGLAAAGGEGEKKPKGVQDFRRILDDKSVNALFIAAPNHWHAPATILACAAGKHVYVEKPGSHNAREAEMMVAAARKHRRAVQMGNQRRSSPTLAEAIAKLRAGAIGRVTCARCWYNNTRPSIGRGKLVSPPQHLDYALWQGPAPARPYKDNVVHYNWHWHWHWGGGELANNGIHALDIARWGLDADLPQRVTCNGGRYHHDDDQETPDTSSAFFDFGDRAAIWEASSCHPRRPESLAFVTFYGTEGSLAVDGGCSYRIHDLAGKEVEKVAGVLGEREHFANFLAAVRGGAALNAEIEDAQKSTLLCHLGNIAYRSGRTVHFDPERRAITNAKAAAELWGREYEKGWQPEV
jgi:predicted dehydrogenase